MLGLLVPTIGFELMTYRLQGDCTTTVLSRQKRTVQGPSSSKESIDYVWLPRVGSNHRHLD